jgi:hypothetical protein
MILGPSYPRISEDCQLQPAADVTRYKGCISRQRIVCRQVNLEPTQPTLAELSSAATADQHAQSRIFCLSMRLACLWEIPRHVVTRPLSEGRVHTPSQRQHSSKSPRVETNRQVMDNAQSSSRSSTPPPFGRSLTPLES